MHKPARPPRRHHLTALLALLVLIPAAALPLIVSQAGRTWLDRIAIHPKAAAVLPGITVETARTAKAGLVVTSIRSDSQAASRGIAVGDSIIAIDGSRMLTLDQARHYLQNDTAGTVELRIANGRKSRDIRLGREGGQNGSQAAGGRGRRGNRELHRQGTG